MLTHAVVVLLVIGGGWVNGVPRLVPHQSFAGPRAEQECGAAATSRRIRDMRRGAACVPLEIMHLRRANGRAGR